MEAREQRLQGDYILVVYVWLACPEVIRVGLSINTFNSGSFT